MQIIFFLLIFGVIIGHHVSYSEKAVAVQIVHVENHSILVDSNILNQILGNEYVKDRNVMVFSIAGPYRKGKSFFLNFPLKYLYAQYVKHDISDWLGEDAVDGNELHGFKWRGGQKPQTTGIWMWSEIFTHDFHNGDRVAIILLDTQGIFDHESSTMDCTKMYAISMLLSSVQCYNVMQDVQENSLQDLDLFAEYGRLGNEHTNESPLQKLLFLVRDWPHANEIDYGYSPDFVGTLLTSSDKQSPGMRKMRERIKLSFAKIDAFLMPYPGTAVAEGTNTEGDLRQMDSRFIQSVKDIVPSLFAPENLVVKRVNGETIRAYDFVAYLEQYAKIFNGHTLPHHKLLCMYATAEASLLILNRYCLDIYVKKMQEVMASRQFDFEISVLLKYHAIARNESLRQFRKKPKFDLPVLVASCKGLLETDMAVKYMIFLKRNDDRRADRLAIEEEQRETEKLRQYITDDPHQDDLGSFPNMAVGILYGTCIFVIIGLPNIPHGIMVCSAIGVTASIIRKILNYYFESLLL